MVTNGYDKAMAETAVKEGDDLVAFGKFYMANPDLMAHLKQGEPFNQGQPEDLVRRCAAGYADYPTL